MKTILCSARVSGSLGLLKVSPTCPHGMNTGTLGNIDDDVDVSVVVVIRATGDFNVAICHANVLGIHLEIFRRP